MKRPALILLLCPYICAAWAQGDGATSEKIALASPKDISAYQITFSYSDESKKEVGIPLTSIAEPGVILTQRPRRIIVQRYKPATHVEIVDIKGKAFDQWSDGVELYLDATGADEPSVASSGDWELMPICAASIRGTYPDLEWISAATFTGLEEVGGKTCQVFRQNEKTVWIDRATHEPVKWVRGPESRIFERLPTPTAPLSMPPRIAEKSAAAKKDRAWLAKPVPRGG